MDTKRMLIKSARDASDSDNGVSEGLLEPMTRLLGQFRQIENWIN